MISPEDVLERLNPWVAMPVGLRLPGMKETDTVTRLKRLNEVLDEMQQQQLVDRARAWKAASGIPDIRRMRDVVGKVLDEIVDAAHSEADGHSYGPGGEGL